MSPEHPDADISRPNLLQLMKRARIWLYWKSIPVPGKKPRKVPFYVNGKPRGAELELDTPADREQLTDYEEAVARFDEAKYAGLAIALGPDGGGGCWQGIDGDNIVANGLTDIADYATKGALAGYGYVEQSPSGDGIHILGYGRAFQSIGPNSSGIEAYAGGRFFTFTGSPIVGDSPCYVYDLADYVELVLAPRHDAARASSSKSVEEISIDPKTVVELRSALLFMSDLADDYHFWIRMGLALSELGPVGKGLWLEWSSASDKFNLRDAVKKWRGFKPKDTSFRVVFTEAQNRGWPNPASSAARIGTPQDAPRPAHFRLLLDKDLDGLPAPCWLVKGIVPDSGVGVIYGDSGTYKSFIALDLLAHLSNGRIWFGRKVKPVPVVYVPLEGQGGIPRRIKAWRLAEAQRRNPSALVITTPPADVIANVAVIKEAMNLRDALDRDRLVATLVECGWAGGVLCIDTLAHASNGIDENSSEMGEMITIFADLQKRLGGVILLIHHSGKDQSRGLRGWSGIHAAMDFVIECQRDKSASNMDARFIAHKVKDGQEGQSFDFRMQMMVLGFDEDDEAITSLTVCPVDRPKVATDGARPTKKGIADIDADTSEADDQFLYTWAKEQVIAGSYPSKNSLKGQLPEMKTRYEITQNRVNAAADRLIADGRLAIEPKSPNGNQWLRPIEQSPAAGLSGAR